MNEYEDLVERLADLLGFPEFPEPNDDQSRNDVIEGFLRDALNQRAKEPPRLKQMVTLDISPEEREEVAHLLRTSSNKIFAIKYLYQIYKKTIKGNVLAACRDTVNLVILEERIPAYYAITWHHAKNQGYDMSSIGKGDPDEKRTRTEHTD